MNPPFALSDLTDEELARAACVSADAQSELIGRFYGLIRYHAARYAGRSAADREDYLQEGLIALVYAIPLYKELPGKTFAAYAQRCIVHRMEDHARRERRSDVPNEELIAAMDAQGKLADADTPETILADKESLADRRMRVMALLSDREWAVLEQILGGLTYQETADKLGLTVKAVDSTMQRVRRKMRAVRDSET